MLIVGQLALYCLLFAALVKCAVRENGIHCVYFYPKEYIDEAHKRGLIDKDATMKQGKRFMSLFCVVMLVALVLIVSLWNRVADFKTAYLQCYLFLLVMNWFDGIVIDRIWVGHSKIWHIKGMEGIPYVKPWKTVLTKRGAATVAYLVIALAVAGIVVLVGKIWL